MVDAVIRVLLVDDDADHAHLVRRACAKATYPCEFTHITTGEACLELLMGPGEASRALYDVVLLDYSLPRRNGLEVLAQIKTLDSSPPVIIVTGHGDERIAVEAMKLGASDYLVKSVGLSHLEIMPWAVQRAVEGHRMQRERRQLEAQLIQSERFAAIGQLAAHSPLSKRSGLGRGAGGEGGKRSGEGGRISGEVKELLRAIRVEVERLNSIVSEYLAFARLPRFEFELESLNALLNTFCKFVEPQLRQAKVTLKTDLDSNVPHTLLDAEQIQRALHNFFKNAIEAMPQGGEFSIQTRLESDQIVLRIFDTGHGIPPTDLPHIFDPFFTTKKGGTGLGLPLAQEIIKQHQGTIYCESVPGKGTQFTIMLPTRSGETRRAGQ
ncbi:response regulator [Candidatus Poribacteria bacterium]|nr:response regulator [Candidatus Poribacteria bacterium]